ncbi:MAG TPA: CoA transferase [Candidatus Binatia bacterium]|jgi:crotonobetainyl-CoA:carnitine CoA-transferase CaiB-like acyl-CoA transferase
MGGALQGIRVIEIASYVTGPFAGLLLADMGADVVKLEQPGQGDPFRGWGDNLYSSNFRSLNRNKKSLTLDIRKDAAREIFLKLTSGADIVIENFRPGTLERRGMGYETVRALNPKIVYCSISGFGQTGPYRDRPGYDTVGQAMSGLLSLCTDPEKPQGMGISFSDHLTGIYACYGILSALVHRLQTGEGQRVETSLLRATVSFTSENAVRFFETGRVPRRATRVATAGVFAFTDREGLPFVIHLSSPEKFWRGLLDVVGKPEWTEDPRFRDRNGRQKNHDALGEMLAAIFRTGARADWLRKLEEHDVPSAPLNTMDEVFKDPQVQAYGFPVEAEHPVMGKMKLVGSGVDLSATPPGVTLPPPTLGEHTEEILGALGYDARRIGELKASGVV